MNSVSITGNGEAALGFRQLSSGLYIPVHIKDITPSINRFSPYDTGPAARLSPEILIRYVENLREKGRADATIEKYEHDINSFISWLGERCPSVARVREWAEEQLLIKKAATVNCALAALNGLFRWLDRTDCVIPFYKVQESPYREDSRNLTEEDFCKMTEAADLRLRALLLTFRGTGIRVSELKFFTVEAVEAGRVTVRNKGKIRDVFLDDSTRSVLLDYCKKAGIESGVVFRGRAGLPLRRNSIWQCMKTLARKAGVELSKAFPHNIRHLFAVERFKTEPDIEALRLDMGHSAITTTQRYLKKTLREHWERIKARTDCEMRNSAGDDLKRTTATDNANKKDCLMTQADGI